MTNSQFVNKSRKIRDLLPGSIFTITIQNEDNNELETETYCRLSCRFYGYNAVCLKSGRLTNFDDDFEVYYLNRPNLIKN